MDRSEGGDQTSLASSELKAAALWKKTEKIVRVRYGGKYVIEGRPSKTRHSSCRRWFETGEVMAPRGMAGMDCAIRKEMLPMLARLFPREQRVSEQRCAAVRQSLSKGNARRRPKLFDNLRTWN